jgi:hypothetical protein
MTRRIAFAVSFLLLVGSCGAPSRPAAERVVLPAFHTTAVDGGVVDSAALSGRALALWFWAPW